MRVYAAGDIGWCGNNAGPDLTAAIINQGPADAPVLGIGDMSQHTGTAQDYQNCYEPFWGAFKDRTWPVPGQHDWNWSGGQPYIDYFGTRVGTVEQSWYALDLGPWRFLMLNNAVCYMPGRTPECGKGSAQYQWVEQQLADYQGKCLAAVMHLPHIARRNSHVPVWPPTRDIWALLDAHGADAVLSGDHHHYERSARLAPDGSVGTGPRQFIVGTGGMDIDETYEAPFNNGPQAVNYADQGVLQLDLTAQGYDWKWLTVDGTVADSGTDTC